MALVGTVQRVYDFTISAAKFGHLSASFLESLGHTLRLSW